MGSPQTTSYPRLLHSLKEAAASLECSEAELLNFAADGKIRLCIRIPNEFVLLDIDKNTLELEKNKLSKGIGAKVFRDRYENQLVGNGPVNVSGNIDRVILSKNDCKKIAELGMHEQSTFQYGYHFSEGVVSLVEPARRIKSLERRGGKPSFLGRCFATYPEASVRDLPDDQFSESTKPIPLNTDSLQVTEIELQQFKLQVPSENQLDNDIPQFGNVQELKIPPNASLRLKTLIETFRCFWMCGTPDVEVKKKVNMIFQIDVDAAHGGCGRNRNELIKEVEDKIDENLKNISLFNSDNDDVVKLIRPDALISGQKLATMKRNKQDEHPIYYCSALAALITFVENERLGVDPGTQESTIKRGVIENKLKNKYHFSGNEASIAAKILRHENAASGRPKKNNS